MERNSPPENIWVLLRRMLNCNKQELAAHLGVARHTLARWEKLSEGGENPGQLAQAKASLLLRWVLQQSGAD